MESPMKSAADASHGKDARPVERSVTNSAPNFSSPLPLSKVANTSRERDRSQSGSPMSPFDASIAQLGQRVQSMAAPSISAVMSAAALPNPTLDVSLQSEPHEPRGGPNEISEPLHGGDALDFMQKRFSQAEHSVKLEVIHDDAYIQHCHQTGFKGEEIYKRGQGALPSAIRARVDHYWGIFKDTNRRGEIVVPGIPPDFDITPVEIEVQDYPIRFANPLLVSFSTNFFADPASMAYARIVLHFFLERTFPLGFLSTFTYTPEGVAVYGGDVLEKEVTFSYSVASQQKLTTSMISEIPDDTCDSLIIPVPNDMVGDPMDLLRCHKKLMDAAGTPHLSLIDEHDMLRPAFGVMQKRESRYHLSFQKMPLLADSEGNLNFNQWPHYLFTNTLYKTDGGDVREGLFVVKIEYKCARLCTICFQGNHPRSECPYYECCKMCWDPLPDDVEIKEHLRNHCPVLKELISKDPTIMPTQTRTIAALPFATSASSTTSSLGKRALESMPQQDPAARKAAKTARQQARNAKRMHRRTNKDANRAAAHAASLAAAAAHADPTAPRN